MEKDLAVEIQQKTVEKVFEERSEFIIIGLTGSTDSGLSAMTDVLTSDFDRLLLSEISGEDVTSRLEYENICNYAQRHWKKFDLIKARDIIITYILENHKSLKRFYDDISQELFKNTEFCNRTYAALESYKRELDAGEDTSGFSVSSEIDDFIQSCYATSLEECLLLKNNELTNYIDVLRNKNGVIWNTRPDLSLYIYTKYILPAVGKVIREMTRHYVSLFQRYGNEIRFFGTLDMTQWKTRLEEIQTVGKFDYFYSIAKRINTFIKIRRAPMSNQKSVPVRIVIDSLKNPYEFSFLKDRYSAYYTFAMLEKRETEYDDNRFAEKNHDILYEQPNMIKNNFKIFVRLMVEQLQRNVALVDGLTYEYLQALMEPEKFMKYLYKKLEEAEREEEKYMKLCPIQQTFHYSEEYAQAGIMKEEFFFYQKILREPVRAFCMMSDLFPFYLQDIQSATQNSDIFFSNMNTGKNELVYQIVRYVSLIMHPGLVPPTKEERCMQAAFSAKVNSGCISRQVGAVVTDKNYNILSLGWNDVHCDKVPCVFRSLKNLQKSRDKRVYSDLELRNSGLFKKSIMKYDFMDTNMVNCILDGLPSAYCFKSMYNGLIHGNNPDYSRAIHAEARAFWACNKELAKDGCLFTTSSSCENCTMLANEYGIKKIYYIEKYPGISQEHVNASGTEENRAKFILFEGVTGEAYMKIYTPIMPLKDELQLRGLKQLYREKSL